MTVKKDMRIEWIDQSKGIAIFLVVLGHVLTNGISSGLVTQKFFTLLVSLIYSFHMPLFFFISGYLQSLEFTGSVRSICQKFGRGLMDLFVPYIVFSYAYLLIKIIFGASTAVVNQVSLKDFLAVLIVPVGEYWYLYALMLFSTMSFLLKLVCCSENKPAVDKMYILGIVVLLSAIVYFGISGISSKVGIIRASHQGVFYFGGMFARLIADREIIKWQIPEKWKLGLLIILLSCLYGAQYMFSVNHVVLEFTIAITMILLFTAMPAKTDNILAMLGRSSLPIYLMHVFVVVLCKILLPRIGINNVFIYVSAATVVSIAIPYYAYKYVIAKVKWMLFFIKPFSVVRTAPQSEN